MSQKRGNGGFSVPCQLTVFCIFFFTSLDKASSAEENDTKIIKFGWVIWILCPFLEIQSFSNFAWFLRPMSEELCREKPSKIMVFCGRQLIRVSFVATNLMMSKNMTFLARKVLKIRRSAFFGTPGTHNCDDVVVLLLWMMLLLLLNCFSPIIVLVYNSYEAASKYFNSSNYITLHVPDS